MKTYKSPTVTPLGPVARLTAYMLRGSYLDMLGMLPNGNTGAMMAPGMM
jgi:hypothetical protein